MEKQYQIIYLPKAINNISNLTKIAPSLLEINLESKCSFMAYSDEVGFAVRKGKERDEGAQWSFRSFNINGELSSSYMCYMNENFLEIFQEDGFSPRNPTLIVHSNELLAHERVLIGQLYGLLRSSVVIMPISKVLGI